MRYFVALLLLLLTSCFFWPLPAPHGHNYVAIDGSGRGISVFCTPRLKTFVLETKEGYEVELCSKSIIEDTCGIMVYKTFFETKAYLKHVSINDRKFHRLYQSDTISLTNTHTGEKIFFEVPKKSLLIE